MPYRIEYSPDAEDHLRGLTARQQAIVLDTVDVQLVHQPTVETRNRKPMRPNPISREPVILTVDGKPVAALMSIEDTDWETVALSTHPQFLALIERSRARQKAEGGISSTEMRRRLRLEKATHSR